MHMLILLYLIEIVLHKFQTAFWPYFLDYESMQAWYMEDLSIKYFIYFNDLLLHFYFT